MRLEIPGYEYFAAGNLFSGSRGAFNYKVFPTGGELLVKIWSGPLCLDCSQVEQEQRFPSDPEGHAAMCGWLEEAAGQAGR